MKKRDEKNILFDKKKCIIKIEHEIPQVYTETHEQKEHEKNTTTNKVSERFAVKLVSRHYNKLTGCCIKATS